MWTESETVILDFKKPVPRLLILGLIWQPGLRIRIRLIRIQHSIFGRKPYRSGYGSNPNPIRIHGFDDQKLEEMYS
jgi:hypothetical protein